jgi:acetolactate synthase-1/2/3 large subunit
MRVADYIAGFIAGNRQVSKTVFLVSGGNSMHLIDAIGKNKKLKYVCNHHEQACAIAAEGYARVSNEIGVACVTSGPGGTNAITGILGAWLDSMPVMVISGQVKFETTVVSHPELKLRQLGDQEINIVDVVRPITKYAVMIKDKKTIRYHLERAVFEAKSGRPGPVWLDVPLDIQGAQINENELQAFRMPKKQVYNYRIKEVTRALKRARRPVIIAGNGIALAGASAEFRKLSACLKIPVITTFARYDLAKENDPFYFGRFGTVGQRAANFILQNSDLVLAIGARLNIRAISYNWEYLARRAFKIVVDIDKNELAKRTLKVDLPVYSDAGEFIKALSAGLRKKYDYSEWVKRCRIYRKQYATIAPQRKSMSGKVDSYNFFDVISDCAPSDAVFALGNGTACVSSYQSLRLKGSQRVVVNSGCASMGYDLPAAIGSFYGSGKKRPVICVTGDGSIQMNLQELQTIIHNRLPLKIFIFNNEGYISIRNTQKNLLNGCFVGSDRASGVSCPDMVKIASAYGFTVARIKGQRGLKSRILKVLRRKGPVVCEVMLSRCEKMEPKLSSEIKSGGRIVSKPLEDMYPFLERSEFNANMIIPAIND